MRARTIFPLLALCAAAVCAAHSAEYFVDHRHGTASDNNPGTENSPWRTLSKANTTLVAGDTVYIKPGVYDTYVAPANSGTASSRITYEGLGIVVVSNTTRAVYLVNRSYVTVRGIAFTQLDNFLRIENGQRNVIANCSFVGMRASGQWAGSRVFNNSTYNQITNCVFAKWGYFTADDIGSILDIGSEHSTTDQTRFNLVQNCTLYHGGHHVLGLFGNHNVLRNNYLHNENWYNGFGNRNLYLHGNDGVSARNLVEGNRIAFSGLPSDNVGATGMLLTSRSNIVRFNNFYENNTAGLSMSITTGYLTSPQHNMIYHNTFYRNGWLTGSNVGTEKKSGMAFAVYSGTLTVVNNVIKNNLFFGQPRSYGVYHVNLADQVFAGNWEQAGDPLFVDPTSSDPANAALPNLRLRAGSPCIDRGVALTTIASASGSGTSFRVGDAKYFMDGWGIVEGDLIQLHGTTSRARVTNVNYGSNVLTVDRSVTWTQNQGLSLAYQGAASDVGAHESGGSLPPAAPKDFEFLGAQ